MTRTKEISESSPLWVIAYGGILIATCFLVFSAGPAVLEKIALGESFATIDLIQPASVALLISASGIALTFGLHWLHTRVGSRDANGDDKGNRD